MAQELEKLKTGYLGLMLYTNGIMVFSRRNLTYGGTGDKVGESQWSTHYLAANFHGSI